MKKLIPFLIAILFNVVLNAQQLNNDGKYITADNELFNGTIVSVHDGVKAKLTVKNGDLTGEATYFYASGKIMETGSFLNGKRDQEWIRYNESGTKSAIAFYNAGKKNGTWLVFDDNGKKRFEMNYTDGEKTGKWTNWDENGVVVNTKDYSISN